MMNGQTIIYELALQEAVRRQMDIIVRAANADAALLEGSGMEKNQIRNVLNVAEESRSLAVVTNFIRYQLGRSQTGPAWRRNGFGVHVIEQIESSEGLIARQAGAVLERLRPKVGQVLPEMADEVRYELVRYYLGYLHRAYYYGAETRQWNDLRRTEEEA
jgi:hypothetical protein